MAAKVATAVLKPEAESKAEYRKRLHERIRSTLNVASVRSDQVLVQTIVCLIAEVLTEFKGKIEADSTHYRQAVSRANPASFDPESMVQKGKALGRATEASDLARELEWVLEALE
jgi:hypothetical protein